MQILPSTQIQLTWNSSPGATYTVQWSPDLNDFSADVGDDFLSDGATTTVTFDNPTINPGNPDGGSKLFLRVSENE